jgi:hypothetical protein
MSNAFDPDEHVLNAIKQTCMKFRKAPQFFFTESDLVAYFCHALYSTHMVTPPGVYWVHCEYPTVFRYSGKLLKKHGDTEIYRPTIPREGTKRGNYDLVVLDEAWIEEVVGEDQGGRILTQCEYDRLQGRKAREEVDDDHDEFPGLRWAIEFKFATAAATSYADEVRKDTWKLEKTLEAWADGSRWTHSSSASSDKPHCLSLVFANVWPTTNAQRDRVEALGKAVTDSPAGVAAVLTYAALPADPDHRGKKIQLQPLVSLQAPGWADGLGQRQASAEAFDTMPWGRAKQETLD